MVVMKCVFWLTCTGVVLAVGALGAPRAKGHSGVWALTRDVLILFAMGVLGLLAFFVVARALNAVADLLVDFVHILP